MNSPLVDYTRLSPNHSGKRTRKICRITPHIVVGQLSVESIGSIFAPVERQASSNYGIGSDGRVGMYVEEHNRSWCSSSNDNDQQAITIECASDLTSPYALNTKVYAKLIDLCVDACKRNGKTKLLWLGDKEKTLSYKPKDNEMVLTCHKWFKATSCPGNWLYARMGNLATEVTKRLTPKVKLDNTPDSYAKASIEWAIANEVLRGDTDGNYKLHSEVTRQDALEFIYRTLNVLKLI